MLPTRNVAVLGEQHRRRWQLASTGLDDDGPERGVHRHDPVRTPRRFCELGCGAVTAVGSADGDDVLHEVDVARRQRRGLRGSQSCVSHQRHCPAEPSVAVFEQQEHIFNRRTTRDLLRLLIGRTFGTSDRWPVSTAALRIARSSETMCRGEVNLFPSSTATPSPARTISSRGAADLASACGRLQLADRVFACRQCGARG